MPKYKKPMGVKKTAAKAEKMKKDITKSSSGSPRESTKRIVRQNSRGKVTAGEKFLGVYGQTSTEKKAEKIVQTRREADRGKTATRAKGIAARQAKVAKARRAKKAVGN